MPKLIRLYVANVLIGFGLAAAFVAALLALDVAGLRHLVLRSDAGWLGGLMLVAFNGIVFAGVQFGIAVMRLAADEDASPPGGRPEPATGLRAIPVPATAPDAPRRERARAPSQE